MSPTVVGLDLSLRATGVATIHGTTVTIRTDKDQGDAALVYFENQLVPLVLSADLVVMEDLPFSAMNAGTTGMVQGIARALLQRHKIPYAMPSPASLKKFATDNGGATKREMAEALLEHYGIALLRTKDNNEVDAAWLRIAGLHVLGQDTTLAHRLPIKGKWESWEGWL